MKSAIVAIALLGLASTAQAQQQVTPSQMALQIDNAVNGLAQSVEALQALIATNPYAIIKTLADGMTEFALPDGDIVEGAAIGWTGEGYALVAVPPFAPPAGQQITGEPTYAIDGSGNVTETYATMPLPPPPITTIQIVSTSTPAFSGTYPLSTQQQLAEVAEYVMANQKFPDALATFPVTDTSGTVHEFTTAEFLPFVSAIADFQTALDLGQSPTQPSTIP